MKKTYLVPAVKEHTLRIKTYIADGSPMSDGDYIPDNNYYSEDETLGKTIWNDETADGFNW